MFFHFAIFLIITKKKGKKFNQKMYDNLFFKIENDLRELGFGDVAVNAKMKSLNKILYDILLKLEKKDIEGFQINQNIVFKYFDNLKDQKNPYFRRFESYFIDFYNFCFELPLENMVRGSLKFNK